MGSEIDFLEIFRRHGAAERTLEIDKIMATISDHPVWEVWPYLRFEGREAVRAWYERQIIHYYPYTSNTRSLNQWCVGKTVIAEAEFVYTPPGSKDLIGRAVAIFSFDDNRCSKERIYFTGSAFPTLFWHAYSQDRTISKIKGISIFSTPPLQDHQSYPKLTR